MIGTSGASARSSTTSGSAWLIRDDGPGRSSE